MASLDLDEQDEHRFTHAASGYGAIVVGGDADDREAELRRVLDGPFAVVDCRGVTSVKEFIKTAIMDAVDITEEELEEIPALGLIELERALSEGDCNLLVIEFDSMGSDVQTSVAQNMKGLAEGRRWDGSIGFSCVDGGSVTRAEPDLSARVRAWELEE